LLEKVKQQLAIVENDKNNLKAKLGKSEGQLRSKLAIIIPAGVCAVIGIVVGVILATGSGKKSTGVYEVSDYQSGRDEIIADLESGKYQMGTLRDFRQKFPEYNDLSDTDLATRLHQKYYPDINRDDFFKAIEVGPTPPVAIRQKPSYGGTSITNLRSSYRDLSVSQVQSMSNVSIRKETGRGFYGHSTINHDYNLKTIRGDKVVVDSATGLMWHQSGSRKYMNYKKAMKWISKLNRKDYAGYHDWRLPTVEEVASLLESSKRNGLYIDPVFSNKQVKPDSTWSELIWTGDRYGDSGNTWWLASFNYGYVLWSDIYVTSTYYVRPVRSME
jgi:hypothetical protein